MPFELDPNRSIGALLHVSSFARPIDGNALGPDAPGPMIAVSRQVGARGATVARAVGARLGWPVYDHELLDRRRVRCLAAAGGECPGSIWPRCRGRHGDGGAAVRRSLTFS